MKKAMSIILIICLILGVFPLGVSATTNTATSGTTGDCTWKLEGTVLTISGNGNMGNYTYSSNLPWGTDITEVIIEEGVTSVGNYSFYECRSLISAIIPEGIISIGDSSFGFCNSLKSITIPSSLKSFGNSAFNHCSSLSGIIIPDGVTSIGSETFKFCSKFTEITIPNSVKSISKDAFVGCSFKNIVIPNSVTSIGAGAFGWNNSLTSMKVDENNPTYYSSNNCIIRKSTNVLIAGCKTSIIPDNIISIEERAFTGIGLINIEIPDSVTKISGFAFSGSDLTQITIPKSVTDIAYGAFFLCDKLTDVYYSGNKTDKNNIKIGGSNEDITDAKWHYSPCENNAHVYEYTCSTICQNCEYVRTGETSHMYDNDCDATCNICGESRNPKHLYIKNSDNTAICRVCNMSKTFDFIITTDETITLSYEATKEFEFSISDTTVAKIGDVSSSVISMGSYYRQSSSAKVLSVFPGETTISVVDANGTTLTTSSLLVVEGNHKMNFLKNTKDATCSEEGIAVYKCYFCGFEEERPVEKIEHIYGEWQKCDVTNHKKICDCGDTIYEKHSFNEGIVTKNPTINEFGEKTYTCQVCHQENKEQVDKLIVGNLDNDFSVTDADAVYLLMHTFFPEDYAVNQPLDFNGDDSVTDADAVYLLMYTFFPEDYPIN